MHSADGSPELILRDTGLGYAGVWAPEQQVCLENPEVKTICVWFHPKAAPPKRIPQLILDLAVSSDYESGQANCRSGDIPA